MRADEFVTGERGTVVGVYWIGDDGARREPLAFQVVKMHDGQIAHIQDFDKRERALKAAGAARNPPWASARSR